MNRYSIAIFAAAVVMLVIAAVAPSCADQPQCVKADYFQRVANGR